MSEVGSVIQFLGTPAAIVATVALLRSHRTDRRDLMLKMHEALLAVDVQRGRRLLFENAETGEGWEDRLSADDRDQINRALALFDVLGYYVHRKYVRLDDALELWGYTTARCWEVGLPYLAMRRERPGNETLWPFYEELADEARVFTARQSQVEHRKR